MKKPSSGSKDNGKYTLQSVDNALRIIEFLGEGGELTTAAVSEALGIGKSTAFRLLSTLESRNFVTRNADNRYSLSMRFTYWGTMVLSGLDIIKIARPHLEKLSAITSEDSHLVVWDEHNNIRYIDKVECQNTVSVDSYVGLSRKCYTTATGKVLLAHKGETFIDEFFANTTLEAQTPYTNTDPVSLRERLSHIRSEGFCISCDEDELGFTCVAAPIFNEAGQAVAAISISGPSSRMAVDTVHPERLVVDTAKKITEALRH